MIIQDCKTNQGWKKHNQSIANKSRIHLLGKKQKGEVSTSPFSKKYLRFDNQKSY